MEYILIGLFGGGTLDWVDISKTEYEWQDIFDNLKLNYGSLEEIDMNTIYYEILEMAISDLEKDVMEYVEKCPNEVSEKFKDFSENIFDYFEIYCNYLDTHLTCIVDEDLKKEIQEKMALSIDEINDKIGFTYIEF